ncbi:hypothetical protein [Arthrobacter rhombi]|uniref:Uncharacterized protein n=1 Tax=Arthrobacter rhombi TaxID=71253 RepID=A0A1R4G3J8_9MICC|nr:hypothetical protein [Arthrobacter rhombi]SJM62731.1 hypothetical protein FM101_07445 [Arthrobacter rhombi]
MNNDKETREWVKGLFQNNGETRLNITEARTAPQDRAEDQQMREAMKSLFQDDEGDTRLNIADGTPKPYTDNQ